MHRYVLIALALGASSAEAAEIVLRVEAHCAGALVRLDDVAEIYAADADQRQALARVELFPTPAAGSRRFVRAREIQDLLAARGVNLAEHRLSGASQVEVSSAAAAPLPTGPGPLAPAAERQAREALCQAVVARLQAASGKKDAYQVELSLSREQARVVLAGGGPPTVQGGASPWVGRQEFVVTCGAAGVPPMTLEARVSLPPVAVMALRTVNRGALVQAGDVVLERIKPGVNQGDYCDRIEDVVGREATRTFGEGQFVERGFVRPPLLVRRGDAVTVVVRSAGLRVRTTARCRDDGSRGELVTVENMLNRQTFFARVVGIQEVEVYARAPDAVAAAAPAASAAANAPVQVHP